jgi:hypothetical protein
MARRLQETRKAHLAPRSSLRRRRGPSPSFEALESRTLLDAGSIAFGAATSSAADTVGTAPIVLTRTGGNTGAVAVKLATNDGTALAGTYYDTISGSVSFPDGVATETINLAVHPDPVANLPGRTVNLTLSNPTGGARSERQARPC